MMSINYKAPVQCSKSIVINATPEQVWRVLTDINQWSVWQPDIHLPSVNGPLQTGSLFNWKTGGANIRSTVHTLNPWSEFGWTGKAFGTFAIHNWTLTKRYRQTEVRVEESLEGPMASLFKPLFNKKIERGMVKWLNLLKKTCEN